MSARAFDRAIPKRKYRERAQPSHRAHLGLLEKKKDYLARAKDYHDKENALHKLKLKSALKNPDEFYFSMVKEQTKEGLIMGKRNQAKSQKERRIEQDHSLALVNHRRAKAQR